MFVYVSVKVEQREQERVGKAVPLTVESAGLHLHGSLFLFLFAASCDPCCLPVAALNSAADGGLALFTLSAHGRRVEHYTSGCVMQQMIQDCKESTETLVSQWRETQNVFVAQECEWELYHRPNISQDCVCPCVCVCVHPCVSACPCVCVHVCTTEAGEESWWKLNLHYISTAWFCCLKQLTTLWWTVVNSCDMQPPPPYITIHLHLLVSVILFCL